MKWFTWTAILLASTMLVPLAMADEGDKSKADKKPEAAETKVTSDVQVFRFGKVIEIGPDGKVKVTDAPGNTPPEEVVRKVTKDAQARMKIVLDEMREKQAAALDGKKKRNGENEGAAEIEANLEAKVREELKKRLPKEVQDLGLEDQLIDAVKKSLPDNMKKAWSDATAKMATAAAGEMRVVVIGPDGKRQEIVTKVPDAILGGAEGLLGLLGNPEMKGGELPPEVKEALQAAEKELKESHEKAHRTFFHNRKANDDIGGKLDKILERLDRLEAEMKGAKGGAKVEKE